MNGQTYNTNNVVSISDHHSFIDFHKKNNTSDNGNGGGGDDMKKRIKNIENDIKVIKNNLNDNNNELKIISTKLESSEKVINVKLDSLKESCISYKELLTMLAGFTAVIGFLIKYFH